MKKKLIRNAVIVLMTLCLAAVIVVKWSFSQLSKQEKCLIRMKVENGHKYWDKDWDEQDQTYEMACALDSILSQTK